MKFDMQGLSDDDYSRTSYTSQFASTEASGCTIHYANLPSSNSSNLTDASKDSEQRLMLEKHVIPGEGTQIIQSYDPTDKEGSDIASNAESSMFSITLSYSLR